MTRMAPGQPMWLVAAPPRKRRVMRWFAVALTTRDIAVRASRALRSISWRYRVQLWPITILLALLQVRVIASWHEPVTVATVGILAAATVVFYLRRKLDRRIEWVYALSCLAAAVLGATLVAALGRDSRPLNVCCVLGWWIGACIWWMHHRRCAPVTAPTDTFIERWVTRIAGGGP